MKKFETGFICAMISDTSRTTIERNEIASFFLNDLSKRAEEEQLKACIFITNTMSTFDYLNEAEKKAIHEIQLAMPSTYEEIDAAKERIRQRRMLNKIQAN